MPVSPDPGHPQWAGLPGRHGAVRLAEGFYAGVAPSGLAQRGSWSGDQQATV